MIKRITKLREEIRELDRLYEGNKETILNGQYISDSEYDKKYKELERLEKKYPEFYDINSPTNKIVKETITELVKRKHSTPMLSLDKATTEEEVIKFAEKHKGNILIQDKLDGLTIVATYNNGELVRAVTRGDGFEGEDVTHTFRHMKNVPLKIEYKGELEIRFEGLVPFKEFERINVDGRYSNPRNLASGSVRQLDSSVAAERNLISIAFDLVSTEDMHFESDIDMLDFLKEQGFETVRYEEFENTEEGIKALLEYIKKYETEIRQTLDYMIDGLVLKFSDLQVREEMGYTSKYPRWAIAYKFESEEDSTKLACVNWQVGKTGQITPVAVLDTVNIGGVNISSATLHNFRNIKDKDIRVGDQVIVMRANDVIPQVVKSLDELRSGEEVVINPPQHCPACRSVTELDGENLYCTGIDCKPQLQKKIEHFASRDAMNIDGLGAKTVETFFENDIIKSFTDIYYLKDREDEICNLPGFGKKSFERLVKGIEKSKENSLDKLIYALSINHIGRSASKDLVNEFKTMGELIDESMIEEDFRERLLTVRDFGEKTTNSVIEFLNNEKNIKIILELIDLGLNMEGEAVESIKTDSSIAGKTFVVTGNVFVYENRKAVQAEIEALGGKVTGSVSKNTDYLINNDVESNSSKNKKAKELNIPIISEEEFIKMIK